MFFSKEFNGCHVDARLICRVFFLLFAVAMTPSVSQHNGMQSAPLLTDWDTHSRSYRIGPVLGKGGFGTVYAGIRLRDGLPVAIKNVPKSSVTAWGQVSFSFCFDSGRNFKSNVVLNLKLIEQCFCVSTVQRRSRSARILSAASSVARFRRRQVAGRLRCWRFVHNRDAASGIVQGSV